MTNTKIFLFLVPLLLLACSLTAQRAASDAMPLPEQMSPASPTEVNPPSQTPAPQLCQVKTGIEAGALNLRACGGTDCPVLIVLHEGESLTVIHPQASNGWLSVKTAGGESGWVNSVYLDCEVTK